jgi:hypothetical protein
VLCGGSGRKIAQVVEQRRVAALVHPQRRVAALVHPQRRVAALVHPRAKVKPRYWGFMGKVRFAIETIVNRVA